MEQVTWDGSNAEAVTDLVNEHPSVFLGYVTGSNIHCAQDHAHDSDDCDEDPNVLELYFASDGRGWTHIDPGDTIHSDGTVERGR